MEKHTKILGLRLSAIVEVAIMLGVIIVASILIGNENRFWDISPHPCWVIVLLLAAQYGTAEAIFATLVCSIYLLFGNMPEQFIGSDMYDYIYEIMRRPVMWFATSVIIGELCNRHIRARDRIAVELQNSREREEKISESYEWVSKLKQKLELRIAGQLRSSIATYNAAKSIETLDANDVVSGVQELIKSVMNPEKFSVYLLEGDELNANIVSGWSHQDEFSRTFSSNTQIYREVISNKDLLCVANDEHERVLDGNGVMAGPLLDPETGQLVGMLKIESLGFTDLNLSSIEAFRAICEWVGMAFINAEKYQAAKNDSVVNPDHNLMTSGYFKRYTNYITSLAKRLNFDVSMVGVKLLEAETLSGPVKRKAAKQLSVVVGDILRSVDLAFDYQEGSGEYSIILPATDQKGARIVLDKIEKGLAKAATSGNVRYAFSVHAIHEK